MSFSNFWILHIKIWLSSNFHENQRKKFLNHFLKHFWPVSKTKMKMKMKKFGKISSSFGFSISKLDYKELFTKIWEKRVFLKFLPEKDILGDRAVERVNLVVHDFGQFLFHCCSVKGRNVIHFWYLYCRFFGLRWKVGLSETWTHDWLLIVRTFF